MITCYEQTIQEFWTEVPCRGEERKVLAWVEDRSIHFGRSFDDGGDDPPLYTALQVPLETFTRVLGRVLGGRDMRLSEHGRFYWQGERIIFETKCNERRSFEPADLDALLTWATAPDEE